MDRPDKDYVYTFSYPDIMHTAERFFLSISIYHTVDMYRAILNLLTKLSTAFDDLEYFYGDGEVESEGERFVKFTDKQLYSWLTDTIKSDDVDLAYLNLSVSQRIQRGDTDGLMLYTPFKDIADYRYPTDFILQNLGIEILNSTYESIEHMHCLECFFHDTMQCTNCIHNKRKELFIS